ncbi:hypothetical protein EGT07_11540 [Herbaspirillum sp. HC18]|nr:hypothetical protein EGT07_11540 [Herbaspirillum sp. HC18]
MGSRCHVAVAITVLVASGPVPGETPVQQEGLAVEVETRGDTIVVDAELNVPVTPAEAWAVLTDYDHMAGFLPHLDYSRKLGGTEDNFQVEQKGTLTFGPLTFSFDSVREVTLMPYHEVRTRLISGNFDRLDGRTQVFPSGEGTHIVYHTESVPTVRLPGNIAAAITRRATRDQLESMKHEIMRRKDGAQK